MEKKKVYNKIFDEQKWKEVNQFNKDLMEDFLMELTAKKKSKGTIDQYRNDLRILFLFIYDELRNKPIHELKKKQFRNYMLWLQAKNLSNARINRLMSACRSMLTFAEDEEDYEDLITSNPAQKVKGLVKESVRNIIFLDWNEVEIIYNELKNQERYQEALLLALAIDSAGRKNELHQVKKDSITEDGNFTNEVIGKRGKRFRLMYNDMTKEAHKLYMEQRGEDDIDSLWLVHRGGTRPASADTLYDMCVSWRSILEDKTGEYREFNVHSFRHVALELLSTGEHYLAKKLGKKFELHELKLLAHHSDLSTTDSYLKNKDDDMLLEAFGI